MFIFGGEHPAIVLSDVVEVYNPKTQTLTLLPGATMPIPMVFMGTGQMGDKILILGGQVIQGTEKVNRDPATVLEFDPKTGRWRDIGITTPPGWFISGHLYNYN